MRAASIVVAVPVPLSVVPCTWCQLSRCAETITTSSGFSVPRSVAITLCSAIGPARNSFGMSNSQTTGLPPSTSASSVSKWSACTAISGHVGTASSSFIAVWWLPNTRTRVGNVLSGSPARYTNPSAPGRLQRLADRASRPPLADHPGAVVLGEVRFGRLRHGEHGALLRPLGAGRPRLGGDVHVERPRAHDAALPRPVVPGELPLTPLLEFDLEPHRRELGLRPLAAAREVVGAGQAVADLRGEVAQDAHRFAALDALRDDALGDERIERRRCGDGLDRRRLRGGGGQQQPRRQRERERRAKRHHAGSSGDWATGYLLSHGPRCEDRPGPDCVAVCAFGRARLGPTGQKAPQPGGHWEKVPHDPQARR
jgi:hypothetical protein